LYKYKHHYDTMKKEMLVVFPKGTCSD